MPQIITFHSFRRGTGKSSLVSNVASLLAAQGARVCMVDTDFQYPTLHTLFNIEENTKNALDNYLLGECEIQDTVQEILGKQLFLVPATGKNIHLIPDGYDSDLLNEGFQKLISTLDLDYLIVDTHTGLNEETLLTTAISDTLVVVMKPDKQDYQGTAIIVDVARHLQVSDLLMVVNKTPRDFDYDVVRQNVEDAYNSTVAAVLPHTEEMIALDNTDIFALRYPEHEVTKALEGLLKYLRDE